MYVAARDNQSLQICICLFVCFLASIPKKGRKYEKKIILGKYGEAIQNSQH